MARATVAAALFALLCVSSSFAAPATEEDATGRDALGCQATLSDLENKAQALGTQVSNIIKLVPDLQQTVLKCLSNPAGAATCIQTGVQGDATKAKTAAQQIEQDVQALEKDLQSVVSKCAGSGLGGGSSSG